MLDPRTSGSSPTLQGLADDLAKRFPDDTSVQYSYLPTLRALSAIHRGEAAEALELSRIAERYDLAVPSVSFNWFFGSRYPTYVRGLACLALRQPHEAAAGFQTILEHGGLILGDPIGAPALGESVCVVRRTGQGQDGIRGLLDAVGKCERGACNSPAGTRGTREPEMSSLARTHWPLPNE